MSEQKERGSNKTEKQGMRTPRVDEHYTRWERRLNAYVKKVNPKEVSK